MGPAGQRPETGLPWPERGPDLSAAANVDGDVSEVERHPVMPKFENVGPVPHAVELLASTGSHAHRCCPLLAGYWSYRPVRWARKEPGPYYGISNDLIGPVFLTMPTYHARHRCKWISGQRLAQGLQRPCVRLLCLYWLIPANALSHEVLANSMQVFAVHDLESDVWSVYVGNVHLKTVPPLRKAWA